MLDTLFLLELAGDKWLSDIAAVFPESCRQANWLAGEKLYECSTILPLRRAKCIVPVGSIQFINWYLHQQGMGALQAMNIPPELNYAPFLGRHIFQNVRKAELPKLETQYGSLLVKPGLHPKRFPLTRTQYRDEIPDDEPLFVSQELKEPILAEWRIFIMRGRIIAARPYFLEQWICPDRTIVLEMASALQSRSAVALDVAALANGRTVVIECHPFIACGLYGFEGPDMLKMAKAAWMEELNRQGSGDSSFPAI